MVEDSDNPWNQAFQEAPFALVFLILGIILGGAAGVWLLIAWLGFDDTPAALAGFVIVGTTIMGGLTGVLVAVFLSWLLGLVRRLGGGKKKK